MNSPTPEFSEEGKLHVHVLLTTIRYKTTHTHRYTCIYLFAARVAFFHTQLKNFPLLREQSEHTVDSCSHLPCRSYTHTQMQTQESYNVSCTHTHRHKKAILHTHTLHVHVHVHVSYTHTQMYNVHSNPYSSNPILVRVFLILCTDKKDKGGHNHYNYYAYMYQGVITHNGELHVHVYVHVHVCRTIGTPTCTHMYTM